MTTLSPLPPGKTNALASTSGLEPSFTSGKDGQNQAVGHRLREARRRRLFTQHALAAAAGVSPVTIARIESRGAPDFPRGTTITKLAGRSTWTRPG